MALSDFVVEQFERCRRVRRCNRVLVDRRSRGKVELNSFQWNDEVACA
jgi:hypothetical protein